MERPRKVIRNPYARKKAPPKPPSAIAALAAPNTRPPTTATGTTSTTIPRFVPTTFSQAFGNDDDDTAGSPSVSTAHTSTAGLQHDNANHTNNPASTMTERDAHVLLQASPHALYVSPKQKGNAVLNYIRNVPTIFHPMTPDYIMSAKRCALFLSCKYHALYPNYIHSRIAALQHDFELRILLVLVDVEDNANTLRILNKMATLNDMTLILAWSEEEAARYLETYKAFDGKDATLIQKREQTHFVDQVADFLTACKTVNKTDSATLLGQFGSIYKLAQAGPDDLALVTGMGQVKVKRLYEAFHKPFSKKGAKRRKQEKQRLAEKEHAKVEGQEADVYEEH